MTCKMLLSSHHSTLVLPIYYRIPRSHSLRTSHRRPGWPIVGVRPFFWSGGGGSPRSSEVFRIPAAASRLMTLEALMKPGRGSLVDHNLLRCRSWMW